jgi:hypothetical protein
MDAYDVGTVQHYSMWLPCKTNHNCNRKTNKYCIVMQFIMCVVFDSIKIMNWKIPATCGSGSHAWLLKEMIPATYGRGSHAWLLKEMIPATCGSGSHAWLLKEMIPATCGSGSHAW